MRRLLFAATVLALLAGSLPCALAQTSISLDGAGWTFKPTLEPAQPVSVPHCWPASEAYRRYIGQAIYQRDFEAPVVGKDQVVRLHFDAVYEHASVWLNGRHLGVHDGGYTPFDFEVTTFLRPGSNHLLVEVSNAPTLQTIPALATASGATDDLPYGAAARISIVGWMPYGGIVRPVSLIVTNAVYIRNVKIDAKPNLASGDAELTVHVWLHNAGMSAATPDVQATIAGVAAKLPRTRVGAGGDAEVSWSGTLAHAHLFTTVRLSFRGIRFSAELEFARFAWRGPNCF
jgi:beta-glucuronidase